MEDKIHVIDGGVTAARGFQAAGLAAGIKKGGKKDMAMIYSEKPCVCAGTFTTNVVKAAPVKWDQKVVEESSSAQAVVCNSGIANACTGQEGYNACRSTAQAAAQALGIPADSVLVASTGVIGQQLPVPTLEEGVKNLDYDYRYCEKGSGRGDRAFRKESYYRRYVQRIRNDPSEYVYHAFFYHYRCRD